MNGDAFDILTSFSTRAAGLCIYCDPPYLMETRTWQGDLYKHEFGEPAQHEELLDYLTSLSECGASIVISGYASSLYNFGLAGWRRVDFQAMTHRGPRTESLWCNFPEPTDLHDKRFIGKGWRERQRIQRKKARWMARLARLMPLERAALIEAVQSLATSTHAASGVSAGLHAKSDVPRVTTNPA